MQNYIFISINTNLNNDKVSKSGDEMTGILRLYSGGTEATRSYITFAKYRTGTKILQQGDDLGDFTLTLPGEDGTLATKEEFQGIIKGDWLVHYLGRRVVSSGTNQYSYLFIYQQNVGTVAVNNTHGYCYYGDKTINLPVTVTDIKATANIMPNTYVIWGYISGQSTTAVTVRAVGGMSSINASLTITILAYAVTSTKITA